MMGGRLGENPFWCSLVSPLFFQASLLDLVVSVAEVAPTTCGTCSGGISLATGVHVQGSHPVTFRGKCRTAEEV